LENEVWSKTATACLVACCSAIDHGSQLGLPQAYSIAGRPVPANPVPANPVPANPVAGANTFARSQPIFEPKHAPASRSRW
jgi:hypothetical protein